MALADQVAGHPLGLIDPALYVLSAVHALGLVDITSGNNTTAFTDANDNLVTVQGTPLARATTWRPALAPSTRRCSSPSSRASADLHAKK